MQRSIICLLVGLLCACDAEPEAARRVVPQAAGDAHPLLLAHSEEFERRVYPVVEGVHVAVGFALANSILIEGDECVVIVDVTESVESAREVWAEFQKISDKPIGALIYTHNHADHVFGARGFVPTGELPVYAHDTTDYYIDRVVSLIRPIISARSDRMFGNRLPREGPDRIVNDGIGPALGLGHGGTPSLMRPNHTFSDELDLTLCGERLRMVHAPGETNDQIFVWLPDKRVLLPGDNVYKAFPNLYTIRGTLHRDLLGWVRSLDTMRALAPEHLVMSHTRPVSGAREIEEILIAYRDAIQFVHDQTVRGMNRGFGPDDLVEFVKLPPHLASHPYLQELYGTVEWSVRSVFSGYLGWFDGDSATLSPASPRDRAAGIAELAGGVPALRSAAERALSQGRAAWAAELASHLLRLTPEDAEARRIKAQALRALGRDSVSPNGRNYYLTQALELEGALEASGDVEIGEALWRVVEAIPVGSFLSAMPVNLDPEKCAEADFVVGFRFPDVGEDYTVHVRRGVAELRAGVPGRADVTLTLPSSLWKAIVVGARNPALALASDEVQLDGSVIELVRFLGWFR